MVDTRFLHRVAGYASGEMNHFRRNAIVLELLSSVASLFMRSEHLSSFIIIHAKGSKHGKSVARNHVNFRLTACSLKPNNRKCTKCIVKIW